MNNVFFVVLVIYTDNAASFVFFFLKLYLSQSNFRGIQKKGAVKGQTQIQMANIFNLRLKPVIVKAGTAFCAVTVFKEPAENLGG